VSADLTERSAEEKSARRTTELRRRRTTLEVVGGVVVALGVALVVHSVFEVTNILAIVLAAYAAFVLTVAAVEFASAGEPDDATDLDAAERAKTGGSGTGLHVVPEAPADDVPIRRRNIGGADIAEGVVALIGGVAFAELVRVVLNMQSLVGAFIWGYAAFIVLFFLLTRDRNSSETALDRVVTVLVWSVGILVAAALAWMVIFVVVKGLHLLRATFFTEDMSQVGPLTPGGGVKHALIGTIEQVGLATLFVIPVGILTAVYLHEVQGRIARPVRFISEAMSGLPSIVAGLLIFTIWVLGHGFSGLAAAGALAVLMLPTMTRATEEILRTVDDALREGAMALGAPHWRVVQRVVLPTALAGIVTAALLSIARAIGETAPLLLTAFGADTTNTNPFHGPQSALPLFVWKLIFAPNETQKARAFGGALVLILFVFVLFASARIVAGRGRRRLQGSR
jgi:phosphate transport system permease protein